MQRERQLEKYPDSVKLFDTISASEPWNPGMRKNLEEILKSPALCSALREVLVLSDDKLKAVGMSDLTNQITIQNSIRAQGVAAGLMEAIDCLCVMAATPEDKEENANV